LRCESEMLRGFDCVHRIPGRWQYSQNSAQMSADRFEKNRRGFHAALEAGINRIDTADVYGAGESEEIVGKALVGCRRDNVILATKFHNAMGDDPNQRSNSRRWIMRAVEDSLRRLNTDSIDLYQVHHPDPGTDIDETLGALTDLVHQGKVRYIGGSTFPRTTPGTSRRWSPQRGGASGCTTGWPSECRIEAGAALAWRCVRRAQGDGDCLRLGRQGWHADSRR
jgi:diketogulonate reductase-like aldo/keto reductase